MNRISPVIFSVMCSIKRYEEMEKCQLFWTGKLSLPSKLIVDIGSIIAWITGNARNSSVMKEKMIIPGSKE